MTLAIIKRIVRTCELFNDVEGVRFALNFMYNVPGENSKTVADFYKFLYRITTKYLKKLDWIGLTNIRIYPHTQICQIALRQGFINERTDLLTPTFYIPSPLNAAYLAVRWFVKPLNILTKKISIPSVQQPTG